MATALGMLGLAWLLALIYHARRHSRFEPGGLHRENMGEQPCMADWANTGLAWQGSPVSRRERARTKARLWQNLLTAAQQNLLKANEQEPGSYACGYVHVCARGRYVYVCVHVYVLPPCS